MRVLLDEQLPVDLAELLSGHGVDTVVGRGWAGVKNGDLLQRIRGEYDALATMDRGIEFQQNFSRLPFGVLLVRAPSTRIAPLRPTRIAHLRPLVPTILDALSRLMPGELHRVGV